MTLRNAFFFLILVGALSGVAWAAQHTGGDAGDPVLSTVQPVPPSAVGVPQPVAAPKAQGSAADDSDVPLIDADWAAATAAKTGVPQTALTAYARASLMAPKGCQVGWTTLAGIGYVESHHGTIGDRILGLDGHSSTPIIGPALDGVGPVAAIRATAESTAWHGDKKWDHAIGPMQFLPSTWEQWSADGDGDGVADPHDIDDAALATADYLCADGYDLATGQGWTDAIFGYNHAQAYVDAVYAAATTYADRAG